MASLALAVLVGCFADETQLSGGARCRSGAGWFCGFDGVAGFPDHLYYCATTATDATTALDVGPCPAGSCTQRANAADACAGGLSATTEFGYPGYGWWCGEAFTNGTPGHLYFFDEGRGADLGACTKGCVISGPGVADACR